LYNNSARRKFKPSCLPVAKLAVNARDRLSQQLTRFGDSQLAELSPRSICQSTAHLILATAFFSGAVVGLAKSCQASKQDYLAVLQQFLAERFGLSAQNAGGMIESNARLYKKYKLIENIYHDGWRGAADWLQQGDKPGETLASLLAKHHDLSMSQLHIEGTKEQTVVPPAVEEVIPVAPTTEVVTADKPRRRWLRWLLFLAVAATVAYLGLYPQHIPPRLKAGAMQVWEFGQRFLTTLH
jgi:hypothetical protein